MFDFKPKKKKYQIYNVNDESYGYISSTRIDFAADEYAEKYFEKEWEIDEEVDVPIKIIELPEDRDHIDIEELEGEEFCDHVHNFNIYWQSSRTVYVTEAD